jgi:betaine reductase
VVLITTIVSTAKMMNVSRILEGGGITHPFGSPELMPIEEKEFRKRLVEKALNILQGNEKERGKNKNI